MTHLHFTLELRGWDLFDGPRYDRAPHKFTFLPFTVVWCIEHRLLIESYLLIFEKLILKLLNASLCSFLLCCSSCGSLRWFDWRFKLTVVVVYAATWRLNHLFLVWWSNHHALRMLGLKAYFLYWITLQARHLRFVHMVAAQHLSTLSLIGFQIYLCGVEVLKYDLVLVWVNFIQIWLFINLASLLTCFALRRRSFLDRALIHRLAFCFIAWRR